MGEKRPNFDDITSFDEFIKYYWVVSRKVV